MHCNGVSFTKYIIGYHIRISKCCRRTGVSLHNSLLALRNILRFIFSNCKSHAFWLHSYLFVHFHSLFFVAFSKLKIYKSDILPAQESLLWAWNKEACIHFILLATILDWGGQTYFILPKNMYTEYNYLPIQNPMDSVKHSIYRASQEKQHLVPLIMAIKLFVVISTRN